MLIQELLHKINADKKETIFMWVPGHIGIRGNQAAGRAAKEALNIELVSYLAGWSRTFFRPETFNFQICL